MFARRSLLTGLLVALVACKGNQSSDAAKPAEANLAPAPKKDEASQLEWRRPPRSPIRSIRKWISEYAKVNPSVKINYQSIGSGGGIRQIVAGTVDFGATDAPMKEDESKGRRASCSTSRPPSVRWSSAYNVPELAAALKLTPEVLVDIYTGKIKKWNDPKIKADNADAKLPPRRSASSTARTAAGTTAVFTGYLAKVSKEWKDTIGAGKSVNWPVGLGAKGNEGVTGQVKTTPYTIGYIERAYASQNKLPMAELKNKAGKFVAPSTDCDVGGCGLGRNAGRAVRLARGCRRRRSLPNHWL